MEVIVQNTTKLPIQKEKIEVDFKKQSILFYQAYQPSNTLNLRGKFYIYVTFEFVVGVDDNNDIWIVPKEIKVEDEKNE